jgi:hypothetical protein
LPLQNGNFSRVNVIDCLKNKSCRKNIYKNICANLWIKIKNLTQLKELIVLRLNLVAAAALGMFLFCGCLDTNQKPLEPPTPKTTPDNAVGTDQGTETETANSTDEQKAKEQQPEEAHRSFEVGDGKKGHYEEFGRISIFQRTIGTMYRTQERLNMDMIKHAMNLYKAQYGNFPRTHEEFMTKIIGYNHIKLPELKDGCRYEYNPQTAELEVYGPKELLR